VGVYRPSRTLASTQRRLYMAGGAERQRRGSRRPRAAADATAGLRRALAAQAGRFWAVGGRVGRGSCDPPGSPSRALGGTYQGPLDSAADNLVEDR